MNPRIGILLFVFLIIASAVLEIYVITAKIWASDVIWKRGYYTIWDLGNYKYDFGYYKLGGYLVSVSIVTQFLILLNTLLTLPSSKPAQAMVAMFRSSAMTFFPISIIIHAIIYIAVYADPGTPSTGYVLLGISIGVLAVAIIVGFVTAHYMKKRYPPHWNRPVSGCVFCLPY